jgi:hypothetical protein
LEKIHHIYLKLNAHPYAFPTTFLKLSDTSGSHNLAKKKEKLHGRQIDLVA